MDKHKLEELIALGYSTTKIAEELRVSQTKVRRWLKLYNLKTNWRGQTTNKYKISDEEIKLIYSGSVSLREFLRNLGVNESGGSYYHYKKRLKELGLDSDNWTNSGPSRGGKATAIANNRKALNKKQRLRRPCLKKYLDLNSRSYECEECGLSIWRDKKIKLHIHHKDEDKTNNDLANLAYLCPNCHSLFHYIEL